MKVLHIPTAHVGFFSLDVSKYERAPSLPLEVFQDQLLLI